MFMLMCYIGYEQGVRQRDRDFVKLNLQYRELQIKKDQLITEQENLRLELNSQSDTDWVELALMKGLGLVPEGQIKVLFTEEN